MRARRTRGLARVTRLLVQSHARRQVTTGWRGAAAVCALAWLVVRIGTEALARGLARAVRVGATRVYTRALRPLRNLGGHRQGSRREDVGYLLATQ